MRDRWHSCAEERTDVVVVGSGAAGMNAAIYAAQSGALVTLLDKGSIGRSGASIQANVSASVAPEGGWEKHAEDIVRTGAGLANPELAEVLASQALGCFTDWLRWGVRFALNDDGSFVRSLSRGHSEPRAVSPGYGMGEKVCRALRRRIRQLPGVTCRPYTSAVDLLVAEDQVRGLLAWDMQEGTFVRINAPSVVIASGGAQSAFLSSTASRHLTGDGFAMARRASAELVDMEFVLHVPVGMVAPRPIGLSRTILEPVRKVAGDLRDADDRDFTIEYAPGEGAQAPWADLSRGVAQAIHDGRGFSDGTVRFVVDGGQLAAIGAAFPSIVSTLAQQGVDLRAGVAVRPMAHFFPGGIAITPAAESITIGGLFAAGEAAGGVHGATRLGGDALTAAAVFGAVAGRSAAARSRSRGTAPPVQESASRLIEAVLDDAGDARTHIRDRWHAARSTLTGAGGPLRRRPELAAGVEALNGLAAGEGARLADAPAMNPWFARALDLRNVIDAGRLVLNAALCRRRNLGAHFTVDDVPCATTSR
ncbi:FAD-binding protein [Micromonospora sp. NPDC005113]